MPTLKAKLVNGIPTCPACNSGYGDGEVDDYGSDKDGGYWFTFICRTCSAKKKGKPAGKVKIKYFAGKDFKVIQRRGTE